MKFLYLLLVLSSTLVFFLSSCENKSVYSSSSLAIPEPKKTDVICSDKFKLECESLHCQWNIDRCEDKIKEIAPKIPQSLGKVKMIAVGNGVCAIDMNDELTCIPNKNYEKPILPHPSRKYRHVAMANDIIYSKICATEKNGTSICFSDDRTEISGPTTTKVLETIPYDLDRTVCAFSDKDLFCQSNSKAIEALDSFSKDPNVLSLAGIVAGEPRPKLSGLALGRGSYLKPRMVYALFSSKTLLLGYQSYNTADQWEMVKNSGAPIFFENVSNFSVGKDNAFCLIQEGIKGVTCMGGNFHKDEDMPAGIKNIYLSQVATSMDHTCVITKDTGELKCWGLKRLIKNAPLVFGVKQVAIGNNLICYIDKDDKVNCFGEE